MSSANLAGAMFKLIKPERKIIHRSMGGVIYEESEDYVKKRKQKQEVSIIFRLLLTPLIVPGDTWVEGTITGAVHGSWKFRERCCPL